MIDRVREQVLGYLLGALDDSEMELVAARLKSDAAYQRELACVRRQLERLGEAAPEWEPPPGLARRTCDFVFAHLAKTRPGAIPRRSISPDAAMPARTQRITWLDTAVAGAVCLVAVIALLPAIHDSRFQSRLATCQDNLRQLGLALTSYSRHHDNLFPQVPPEGRLAAAGIYAPMLVSSGYLTEPHRVLCPEPAAAAPRDFRVPSIEELQKAGREEAARLRRLMGGSYGYCIGHLEHGVFVPTKNLSRDYFALMADAPSDRFPDRQSINHGGRGQNVLFEDGHVEFVACPQPHGGADDIFSNDAHEVAAGIHGDDSVIATSGTPPVIYVEYH